MFVVCAFIKWWMRILLYICLTQSCCLRIHKVMNAHISCVFHKHKIRNAHISCTFPKHNFVHGSDIKVMSAQNAECPKPRRIWSSARVSGAMARIVFNKMCAHFSVMCALYKLFLCVVSWQSVCWSGIHMFVTNDVNVGNTSFITQKDVNSKLVA